MNIEIIKSPIGEFRIIPIRPDGFGFWTTVLQLFYYSPDPMMSMPLCHVEDFEAFGYWQVIGRVSENRLLVRNLKKS